MSELFRCFLWMLLKHSEGRVAEHRALVRLPKFVSYIVRIECFYEKVENFTARRAVEKINCKALR